VFDDNILREDEMHDHLARGKKDEGKALQLKELIINKAREGVFDHNPLLSTSHLITCQKCKHQRSIVYLNYLKTGEFEIGTTTQIDVLSTQGIFSFLEKELFTPLVIGLTCDQCSSSIEIKPVSAEYLQVLIDRPTATGAMYA